MAFPKQEVKLINSVEQKGIRKFGSKIMELEEEKALQDAERGPED